LSEDYIKDLRKNYEGTRLGRQELYGEVLRDVEGAMWNDEMFRYLKFTDPNPFFEFLETLDDRVLGVDPAGSKGKRSDATGLIAVGAHHFDEDGDPLPASNFFVLGRGTLKGSPTEWAKQTFLMAKILRVNKIVAEKNFGGDMVKQVLTDYAKLHPEECTNDDGENMADMVTVEHAVLSKETRAEATVGKYEQGRVTHVVNPTVFGDLSELEKQQVGWVPKSRGGRSPSPNDIDALVWAVKKLEIAVRYVAQQATSRDVMSKMKRRPGQFRRGAA
jgi:phage terminase large subunit-like protein